MTGFYNAIQVFMLEHRDCGELLDDADPVTPTAYRMWATCSCGATLDRWAWRRDAEADLLWSALLAFEN